METTALPKRKVIDINGDTFRTLSVMAAQQGTNLKNFIEKSLDAVAADFQDSMLYAWAIENDPEGSILASEEEKVEFEAWLGV